MSALEVHANIFYPAQIREAEKKLMWFLGAMVCASEDLIDKHWTYSKYIFL